MRGVHSDIKTALRTMRETAGGYILYYDAYCALTDTELRRLWIAEGKRRGYELS